MAKDDRGILLTNITHLPVDRRRVMECKEEFYEVFKGALTLVVTNVEYLNIARVRE